MSKPLSELLPTHLPQGNSTENIEDVLTDDEKKAVIENEIDRLRGITVWKMLDKGLHKADVEVRISQIDFLAQIDQPELLRKANQRKQWAMEAAQIRETERKRAEENRIKLLEEWNANRFYNVIKRHFVQKNGHFITGDHNNDFIKAICLFFSNDSRFESEMGYSFGKGLLIQGTAGLGKTETICALAGNPLWPVKIHSILDIADAVQATGECNLNTKQMLLIDDVGTEPELINHYGTKINWFKDFIETYYLHNRTFSGLIITTNLSAEEMERRYGYRVRSRIREMFNVLAVTGKDMRK